jgi:MGT family glycosyltransferase
MRRAHIAFVSYPQYPHVGPALTFAAVLARRGHYVSYATSDAFSRRVAEVGLHFVRFSIPMYSAEGWKDPKNGGATEILHSQIHAGLEQLQGFYEQHRPDVIVYDKAAFAGRIFAARLGVPSILTSPTFAHDEMLHSRQVKDPTFRALLVEQSHRVDGVLERFGIQAQRSWLFHREKLNIFLFPRALQPCASELDAQCFFAGRCPGEQACYGSWTPGTAAGRPILLVSTSTHYLQGTFFFQMWMEALAGGPWHVVISPGDRIDPAALGPLPPHFEVIQHNAHVKILPHVSLFACLGGIVTTAEATYHGVPLIVTSHGFPEVEWQADHWESLGLCAHLRKADTQVKRLRTAVDRISNDALVRDSVLRMQHLVRREPGAEETANRVEEFLETSS